MHYIEGCFTKGTEIVTETGSKKIEDIKVGEKVLTHNGKYKNVYHTQVRPHTGKLFTIEYFGDTTKKIKATDEHPFLAVKRQKQEYKNTEWNPTWVEANKLEKSDYLAIPIERNTETQEERDFTVLMGNGRHGFKETKLTIKTDKDFFRLIGYYLSEGSLVGGHYLHFTFNKNEKEFIEDTKNLLEKYFGKEPLQYNEYKNGISIVLCSTAVVRFFEQQFSKGAVNKQIPNWVKYESVEKQKELIKGFWRGDGSFMSTQYSYAIKRMFRMNTISKLMAGQFRDILLRLNIFASINAQKRTGNRKTMYCVYVGGSFLPAFAGIVGTKIATEVAVDTQKMWQEVMQVNAKSYAEITDNYAFVPIKKITCEEVNELSVYNFSVEEDESYIADGVAVHNCTAPKYSSKSLHSAVVEVIGKANSHVRYTTIQNWANNIYNLVTKRARAYRNATVEWVDGNIGSKVTMKYPAIYLMEEGAKGEVLSIALAGDGQTLDAGAKI
ncbi:MAG: SufD family Fe-S cluster assembly protein, partial [Candidatus Diapherotrites archaeon]|nr:SufD family Fe-S cluster assembly protein [Candidatus Diapherotrites archaeon]